MIRTEDIHTILTMMGIEFEQGSRELQDAIVQVDMFGRKKNKELIIETI